MILIDRRFLQNDTGGAPQFEPADWEYTNDLVLNFKIETAPADKMPKPLRNLSIQAMAAKKFSVSDEPEACEDYRNYQDKLVDFLESKDVQQIAVTRLPLHDGDVTNIRVRLDLKSPEKNFLSKDDLKGDI